MNINEELQAYINRADKAKNDAARLAVIMTDIEQRYQLPALASGLARWETTVPHAAQILTTYRYIANLRDI